MAKLDENGHEVLSDEKIAIPAHLKRPPTLHEQVKALIRSEEVQRALSAEGFETFEEADDFDVGDDYDPRSPHEMSIEQELEGYGDRDQGGFENPTGPSPQGSGNREETVRGNGEETEGTPKKDGGDQRGSG